MSKENVIYRGPSTLGLLGIVFVVLKLTGYINWSWWWVTAPFWIPLGIVAVILAIAGIVLLIATLCK
jgi:hypothetical protein